MKKNKILLFYTLFLLIVYVALMFIAIKNVQLCNYWFSFACVFLGLYSLAYCFMFKLDSSLYYSVLLISIGLISFVQKFKSFSFDFFYPFYFLSFSLASFAVFLFFRQKIHFKLFAIFSIECILLVMYKTDYLSFVQMLITNGLFIIFVLTNAIFRINRNLKEN